MKHGGFAISSTALSVRRGGREVLHGLDLNIPVGQITGLLGPSGCGKSTLLRSIVGVQARVRGDLTVLGYPAGNAQLRTRVAYATQAASVYDDLSVAQNLRYFARVRGLGAGAAERAIERVGLGAEAGRRVHTLSGGQQGRVSLAVALLGEPELIVLDEPTVGLDPVLRAELWSLFRGLASEGVTLLVSSHVMDEALRCDRLLLMRDGRILSDTSPSDLLAETGTNDPEAAFLEVIARAEKASSS
ncbi:ABC transporter ATP-binding protein [Leucobacter sp. HY1910]